MTLVLDASALVVAVTRSPALAQRLADEPCHAPHLLDAEVGSALRKRVLAGDLDLVTALAYLHQASDLVDQRHAHADVLDDAFALVRNLTFYDALYVALASALGVTLLTADARLSRAPGLPCEVEVVGPD